MSVVGLCGGTFPVPAVTLALRDITISGTYVGNRAQIVELIELYKAKKVWNEICSMYHVQILF